MSGHSARRTFAVHVRLYLHALGYNLSLKFPSEKHLSKAILAQNVICDTDAQTCHTISLIPNTLPHSQTTQTTKICPNCGTTASNFCF